ncbi:DNA polymerase delta subunit 3 [Malaya genurostris]|uniref:DNA polymerase delta subunit 3 n=1 Tax=Malaya genurostris TaxID=325434 RepID=UPI0026F3E45B|nr:DNA polymerase delta subunit 3 [Malaya genurostris]
MEPVLEKTCMEEISHTVLDSQQKMSVRTISNNYGLNFAEAVAILQKWIEKNANKTKLIKEFIVRGIDSQKGCAFITVASERKLKSIQSKAKQVNNSLYSVEVASESSRKITVPEDQEFKVINLPLETDKRNIKTFVPAELPPATIKKEPKSKMNSMFTAGPSKSVTKQEPPKPTIKEEKQSSPPTTAKKQESTQSSSPKKSPTKGSPSKKKDAKKPVTGKASIASFFSNKPASSKPAAASTVTVKEEKVSPTEKLTEEKKLNGNGHQDESLRWKRMISDESDDDDVVPNTPQDKKEHKKGGSVKKPLTFKKTAANKKGANPSKKSRILQIEDSSEDEADEKNLEEPKEREIQFDIGISQDVDMKEDEVTNTSPVKTSENDSNETQRKKAKVKKLVTKTFQDEEGYLITEKVYEMVSASEDEADDVSNNNAATRKDVPKESLPNGRSDKKHSKATDEKVGKATPPTPKTKQGSIMSFFSKK